jgi:hypothetical protein
MPESDEEFQDQRELKPSYTFIGTPASEEHLEVARIHFREAKQMEDNAIRAEAEGRLEEASLLRDLAKSRRETAEEFERAAKGEVKDPIVTEILEDQEGTMKNYKPHESDYVVKLTDAEQDALAHLAEYTEPPPPSPLKRALGWFSGKKA